MELHDSPSTQHEPWVGSAGSYIFADPKAEIAAILQQGYKPVMTFTTKLALPPLWSRDHILASGLSAPPDINIMQRIETPFDARSLINLGIA